MKSRRRRRSRERDFHLIICSQSDWPIDRNNTAMHFGRDLVIARRLNVLREEFPSMKIIEILRSVRVTLDYFQRLEMVERQQSDWSKKFASDCCFSFVCPREQKQRRPKSTETNRRRTRKRSKTSIVVRFDFSSLPGNLFWNFSVRSV